MKQIQRENLRKAPAICLAVLLWSTGVRLAAAQAPATDPMQALRSRAEQLYRLLQRRQRAAAEAFVTRDTVENFRRQTASTFLSFQVNSVKPNPDGQSAAVVIQLNLIVPGLAMPMVYPQRTQWRLEEGEWRMVVPDPTLPQDQSPYSVTPAKEGSAPPSEELKFKGHRYIFEGVKKGDVRVARFPFTNETDHAVQIEEIVTGCECLRVKTTKMEYQPGESGQLEIEFNSAGYEFTYSQTIVVRTNPGEAPIHLRVDAQVIPPGYTGPKPREKKPAAAATTEEKKP